MEGGIELKDVNEKQKQDQVKKALEKRVSFAMAANEKEIPDEKTKILDNFDLNDEKFKEDIFNSKSNSSEYKHKPGASRWKFGLYINLILLHTFHIYIVKPLCVILEIVFLSTISDVSPTTTGNDTLSDLIDAGQRVAGWLILFLFPLYNLFFGSGIKIISVKNSIFGKLAVIILLMIEIMINLPLTFLYDNNLYSIFLFEEKGINQILNPWLVFFPTEYILSIFELVRNFVDPLFFLALGFTKLSEIQSNQYQAYLIIILKLMLVMCIMRIIGNTALFSLKMIKCSKKNQKKTSEKRKDDSGENKENELKASGEENTKDKKEL